MAEAELRVLRARLEGGIRNKAARGELRRGLPVAFVWGEPDDEVRFHPDESVVHTLRTAFAKFTELGSVRKVWLWFRSEGLTFPLTEPFPANRGFYFRAFDGLITRTAAGYHYGGNWVSSTGGIHTR